MRRALPFLLFAVAVVTALWLSAQPDRGRPGAARELREAPPVGAGPAAGDTRARQSAVWPPPSGIEAPRNLPAAKRPQPVSAPEPTSAVDETELEPDPEVVAVLERVLSPASDPGPDPEPAALEVALADPDTGAPEFDASAFQWNVPPQGGVFTVVLPPKRAKAEARVSSMDAKRHPVRQAAPLPIALAPAPVEAAPAPLAAAPVPAASPPPPPIPVRSLPSVSSSLTSGELQSLPVPIQRLETLRIETNRSQAAGWTSVSASSE